MIFGPEVITPCKRATLTRLDLGRKASNNQDIGRRGAEANILSFILPASSRYDPQDGGLETATLLKGILVTQP